MPFKVAFGYSYTSLLTTGDPIGHTHTNNNLVHTIQSRKTNLNNEVDMIYMLFWFHSKTRISLNKQDESVSVNMHQHVRCNYPFGISSHVRHTLKQMENTDQHQFSQRSWMRNKAIPNDKTNKWIHKNKIKWNTQFGKCYWKSTNIYQLGFSCFNWGSYSDHVSMTLKWG